MLTAILFDLDGTLVNTDPIHYKVWQDILKDYGIEMDETFYKTRISGGLNQTIIPNILPQLSVEEVMQLAEDKEARFRELGPELKRLAGLDEVLSWTEKHGLKRALVTNAPRKNVDFMLSTLGLTESFEAVILAEETTAGKPDPAPYKLALSSLNVVAEQALAFEDSPSGIIAAVGAGIFTVGIASTHEHEDLYKAGAKNVVADFTDSSLLELLKKMI